MTARPILSGLALSAVMLAVAAVFKVAEHGGFVSSDIATRATQAMIGLMLAFYANFIPKNLPSFRARASARMQSALRVSGWTFALAGLAYAAIWAWAPLATAGDISTAVVATATVAAIGYVIWVCRTPSKISDDPVTH
jgi:hypothetical protein